MSSVDVINVEGTKAGSVELPDAIFDVQANNDTNRVDIFVFTPARQTHFLAHAVGFVVNPAESGP